MSSSSEGACPRADSALDNLDSTTSMAQRIHRPIAFRPSPFNFDSRTNPVVNQPLYDRLPGMAQYWRRSFEVGTRLDRLNEVCF